MGQDVVVVAGATGHIGQRLAGHLLDKNVRVRALGRSAERMASLTARGAGTAVGSLEDAGFVARALQGARAAFVMIPPDYQAADPYAYQQRVATAWAAGLRQARVPHVVSLSSVGAHLAERTGPILGLHRMEQALNEVPGVNTVHLRPAFFMENHFNALGAIRHLGAYVNPMRADLAMAQVATRDIAAAAAALLLKPDFSGTTTRELLGPQDVRMADVVVALGRAIGRPDLAYRQVPYDAAREAMQQMGLGAEIARLLVEMIQGFNEGWIRPVEKRSAANTTPTTIEDFARDEFLTAWQAGG